MKTTTNLLIVLCAAQALYSQELGKQSETSSLVPQKNEQPVAAAMPKNSEELKARYDKKIDSLVEILAEKKEAYQKLFNAVQQNKKTIRNLRIYGFISTVIAGAFIGYEVATRYPELFNQRMVQKETATQPNTQPAIDAGTTQP